MPSFVVWLSSFLVWLRLYRDSKITQRPLLGKKLSELLTPLRAYITSSIRNIYQLLRLGARCGKSQRFNAGYLGLNTLCRQQASYRSTSFLCRVFRKSLGGR